MSENLLAGDISREQMVKVRLSDEDLEKLTRLANEQGITANSVLRKAIADEDYIRSKIKKGCKILIQNPDNTFEQIIFR